MKSKCSQFLFFMLSNEKLNKLRLKKKNLIFLSSIDFQKTDLKISQKKKLSTGTNVAKRASLKL